MLPFLHKMDHIAMTRGLTGLIMYCKLVRTGVINFLSENSSRPCGIRYTKDGIPKDLGVHVNEILRTAKESPNSGAFNCTE